MIEIYSLPYCFLVSIYSLLLIYEMRLNQSNLRMRLICGLIFLFFFGFRGYIGTDWYNYSTFYNIVDLSTLDKFEYGFSIFTYFCKYIGLNYVFYQFFLVLCQVLLFDYLLKEKKNISLYYIMLISFFPVLYIDAVRNFTAILIAVIALLNYQKSRTIAILLFLLSLLFHSSLIVFPIILFFNRKYYPYSFYIYIFIFSVFLYVFEIKYVSTILSFISVYLPDSYSSLIRIYLESDIYNASYGFKIGILEKIFFVFLFLYKYKRIVQEKQFSPLIINLFFIYCLLYLAFNELSIVINRLTLLFFFFYIDFIVNIVPVFYRKVNRSLIYSLIVLLCFAKTYISFDKIIYDYSFVLFQKDDYDSRYKQLDDFYDGSL